MTTAIPRVPTVGSIAGRLGVPVSRVEYIVRSRKIRPQGMAGNARVFAQADVERIASEIRRIDTERRGGYGS